jgi:(p)ppGpp synthase/HD superfamily hydrolase
MTSRSRARRSPATGLFTPDLYARALDLAAHVHRRKKVRGPRLPYVVHVVKVAAEVIRATEGVPGVDRDLAVACALLHDAIEDSPAGERPGVAARIREGFGAAVLRGVQALSKDDRLPPAEQMPDSLRRIGRDRREVWMVKLADRVTNLAPPPRGWSRARRRAYLAEAGAILEALGKASPLLSTRLRERMQAYEAYCG